MGRAAPKKIARFFRRGKSGRVRVNVFDAYLAVGMANSAPFSVLSGQRCMIDFCFV